MYWLTRLYQNEERKQLHNRPRDYLSGLGPEKGKLLKGEIGVKVG